MKVIDHNVTADQLELGDFVYIDNDPIEITKPPVDSIEAILIKGISYESGEDVAYILAPDKTCPLWGA